jgi:hypothetical protein
VVEDIAQLAGEGLGLAGVSELAAEEVAVVAGEHGRPLTEQLGWRLVGEEGEAGLADQTLSVRRIHPAGSLPDGIDDADLVCLLSRAY